MFFSFHHSWLWTPLFYLSTLMISPLHRFCWKWMNLKRRFHCFRLCSTWKRLMIWDIRRCWEFLLIHENLLSNLKAFCFSLSFKPSPKLIIPTTLTILTVISWIFEETAFCVKMTLFPKLSDSLANFPSFYILTFGLNR